MGKKRDSRKAYDYEMRLGGPHMAPQPDWVEFRVMGVGSLFYYQEFVDGKSHACYSIWFFGMIILRIVIARDYHPKPFFLGW